MAKVGPIREVGAPPIMWPQPGSGFVADPYSPAGSEERIWRLVNRRQRGSKERDPIPFQGALPLILLGSAALFVVLAIFVLLLRLV